MLDFKIKKNCIPNYIKKINSINRAGASLSEFCSALYSYKFQTYNQ